MESKKFNIISKILILIFGLVSIFLGFERLEISAVISNPTENFYYNFYFGVISFPSRIDGSGYGIWYNLIVYFIFIINKKNINKPVKKHQFFFFISGSYLFLLDTI